MCIMENMNLLDLNNDILNIIGGYVKADNNIRQFNELTKKEIFDYVDIQMKLKRKEARKIKIYMCRPYTRYEIWVCFDNFFNDHFGAEYSKCHDKFTEMNKFYNEYLTLKKLNLKKPDFKI